MNNSLYKITFYFFICIFISSCGFSLFNNSKKKKQSSETLPKQEVSDNFTTDKDIERSDILSAKRLDNVSSASDDNTQQISILKAKIKHLEKELSTKGKSASIFNNPYALFNQQIIMDNGSIYYGSVIYQDDEYITIETLIGKLNLERNRITRVLSHHLDKEDIPAFPEVAFEESTEVEDGELLYKSPANVILSGNINTSIDDIGNSVLSGQLKNIGGKRADFAKIHMTLYRDWSKTLKPKTFTVFVDGTTHYFDEDSTKISDSSIEPKAVAYFSLIIPKSFGNVMSWKYNIDFEQY
jgi:hypothetical protein